MNAALILTGTLDRHSFQHFDVLRRIHFPPERNFIPAHVTLFHALPTNHESRICEIIRKLCERTAVITAKVPRLRKLGEGVAFEIESPELTDMHDSLKDVFGGWCSAQDRLPYKPHVTIQNRAQPERARALFKSMQSEHKTFDVMFEGIAIWRYMGGPWEHVEDVHFALPATAAPVDT